MVIQYDIVMETTCYLVVCRAQSEMAKVICFDVYHNYIFSIAQVLCFVNIIYN